MTDLAKDQKLILQSFGELLTKMVTRCQEHGVIMAK